MDCRAQRIPYRQTGAFSRLANDYIDQQPSLLPFFEHAPTIQGVKAAIEARKTQPVQRDVLADELLLSYRDVLNDKIRAQIESLRAPNTFTITTAHQPNILTGPLYFLYKIAHTIRLADHLNSLMQDYHFVPVYYMGSEDADLDELGHIHLDGIKYTWDTKQRGAVGRMKVDKPFLQLLDLLEGRLAVMPGGKEAMALIRQAYQEGRPIQEATFTMVHELFGDKGLLVLIPDTAKFKQQAARIFRDDLIDQVASTIVGKTATDIDAAGYRVQANPREINLFYLGEGSRERIEKRDENFIVVNTDLSFSEKELLEELSSHPERFSPNVILRGIYQETILPNVVFVGGGGELAYWLQYREFFRKNGVPMPVLLLRNSFLFIEKEIAAQIRKLGFEAPDFFLPEQELLNRIVQKESIHDTEVNGSLQQLDELYEGLRKKAAAIDSTLSRHVEALKTKAAQRVGELGKKMLSAEKRKYDAQLRQIKSIRERLFPENSLQERYENFLYFYGKWGRDFIEEILKQSLTLEQEFVVVELESSQPVN